MLGKDEPQASGRVTGGGLLPLGQQESAVPTTRLLCVVPCSGEVGAERAACFPGERSSLEPRHWEKTHTRHRGEKGVHRRPTPRSASGVRPGGRLSARFVCPACVTIAGCFLAPYAM
jgi:hypothetical protein